ncbi:hypothetical protein D1BOALGB6SA_5594 [Olavius sp. associated proteobacterium Delta 1]|nr:hypothetical protein D1BOALGB6SA_5594 [Olavius sp. associated proteobacterium Delta 1]
MLKYVICIFLVFSIYGCLHRHVDKITTFSVNGKVYDKKTGSPVSEIIINFIDTGFDDKRHKRQSPLAIGKSDDSGTINIDFEFWWGRTEGPLKNKPEKTFTVELEADNYQTKRFDYRADDLTRENGKIIVPLGNIYLTSKSLAE